MQSSTQTTTLLPSFVELMAEFLLIASTGPDPNPPEEDETAMWGRETGGRPEIYSTRDILWEDSSWGKHIEAAWTGIHVEAEAEADAHGQAAYQIWEGEGMPEGACQVAYYAARSVWAKKNQERIFDGQREFAGKGMENLGYYLHLHMYGCLTQSDGNATEIAKYLRWLADKAAGIPYDRWSPQREPHRAALDAAEKAVWAYSDSMFWEIWKRWAEIEVGAVPHLLHRRQPVQRVAG